ncbi:hypothetical protein N7466_007328 [Penicillium verhagenii]|uniref:uncharacterized protein n=1 Tax=Penicillium verhagenii TaxID=1562060 RepID=UPI0025454374|nr:uncharacterized protein N7466_007328 [Penicillium verhagenii]KAJ5928372.1 hypothetical protein N7466_007328 [Penicillium verhagenii]
MPAGPLGDDDWVDLHLTDSMGGLPVRVQNSELQWGKFYADGNKNDEISPQQVDETVIPPFSSGPADIWTCGREDAPSGSQGSFDLIDQNTGGGKICSIDWNAPYAPGPGNENSVTARDLNSQDYAVDIVGHFKKDNGTLGTVDVDISHASS